MKPKGVFSLTLLDSERPKLHTVSECNRVKERIFFIQSSVHVQTTFTSSQGGDHMVFILICRKEKWQCFVEGIIVYVKMNNIISLSNNLHSVKLCTTFQANAFQFCQLFDGSFHRSGTLYKNYNLLLCRFCCHFSFNIS